MPHMNRLIPLIAKKVPEWGVLNFGIKSVPVVGVVTRRAPDEVHVRKVAHEYDRI